MKNQACSLSGGPWSPAGRWRGQCSRLVFPGRQREPQAAERAGSTFPAHWPKPMWYPSPWHCPATEEDRGQPRSRWAQGNQRPSGHGAGQHTAGPKAGRRHLNDKQVFSTEKPPSPEAGQSYRSTKMELQARPTVRDPHKRCKDGTMAFLRGKAIGIGQLSLSKSEFKS